LREKYNIKAIFFDLGQTLVELSSITFCMYDTLKKKLPRLNVDLNELAFSWGYETYKLFNDLREKEFITTKEMHLLCLNKLLKIHKIDISDKLAYSIVKNVWDDFIKNNKLYPDTIPVLKLLKELEYKLGIITDCDLDVAEGIIRKHNLIDFFDVKVISSVIKSYKPDPLLFNKAIKLAKCTPCEGVYIGDSEIDIKGAKEIGLITVIVDRGEMQNQVLGIRPDFRISSLSELPGIISRLNE